MPILRRVRRGLILSGTALFLLTACSTPQSTSTSDDPTTASPTTTAASSKTVTDAQGSVTVPGNPKSIVATDNRSFRLLDKWGIKLTAGAVSLMPKDVSYVKDKSIADTGYHNEPNLELIVAAKPDLVINGQRYSSHYDDIKKLVPQAAVIDANIDLEKGDLVSEMVRQTTLLGEVLNREEDAKKLVSEFKAAIERAKAAYNPEWKVMGLVTSGGNIGYVAPGNGRAIGPLFPTLRLNPALKQKGSSDHQGDDVSVEAIAASNPDWIIILDRDAAVADKFTSANELIKKSEALKNVPAVKNNNIYVLPANFYIAEDIINYTKILNDLADAWEKK